MLTSRARSVPQSGQRARALRQDALANRERLVAAAHVVLAREGWSAPLASIAAEAGVGIGTFYRSFAGRTALMQELELRAYALLTDVLDAIESHAVTGAEAIRQFLAESAALSDQLVLPLHGAPPLVDHDARAARDSIFGRLDRFIADGRRTGDVSADVNATDIVMCGALVSQPLRHGPNWEATVSRHIGIFVAGLANPAPLSHDPIERSAIETAFGELHGRAR